MLRIAILFFFVANLLLLNGQSDPNSCMRMLDSIQSPVLAADYYVFTLKGGANEFVGDWQYGDIVMENGSIVKNKLIRYNGYLDEVMWLREADYKMGKLYKKHVKSFQIYATETTRPALYEKTVLPWFYTGTSDPVFLDVLVKGDYGLEVYRKIKVIENTGEVFDAYHYYIKHKGEYTRIKLRRFSLIRYFEKDERPRIRKALKGSKISYRTEEGMIKAIQNLNEKYEEAQSE